MALTWYKVNARSVQLPSGRIAVIGDTVQVESTLVTDLVTAGALVATTVTTDTLVQRDSSVVTGDIKPPLIRDGTGESVFEATVPRHLATNIPAQPVTDVFAAPTIEETP